MPLNITSLWICPFRSFFLATAVYGTLLMGLWLLSLSGFPVLPELPAGPIVWHAHEMIYGFSTAAIAGFLLTAVVEFTGCTPLTCQQQQNLLLLWLLARLAYFFSGWLTILPAALLDLAFLLTLLAHLALPLWNDPNRRHIAFLYALGLLLACQSGFYAALLRDNDPMPWLRLSISLLMILVIVALSRISMRMVNDALDAYRVDVQPIIVQPYLARPPRRNLAIFCIGTHGLGLFFFPENTLPTLTGWLALAAGAAVLNLLNDWHVGRALFRRWALIPYLVYLLMGLAYTGMGLGLLMLDEPGQVLSAGHHLLLAGALALAIFIVMVIAGSMHSGHGLDHRRWVLAGSLLVGMAGLGRAAASSFPEHYGLFLMLAGILWMISWGVYLTHSWKTLTAARPDTGKGCEEPRSSTIRPINPSD